MEKIIQGRASGKTTELIKRSAKTGDYIVCHSLDKASNIQLSANEMGLKIPFPISFREFILGEYSRDNIKGFLIDDLDFCLQQLTNVPINAITMSIEKDIEAEHLFRPMDIDVKMLLEFLDQLIIEKCKSSKILPENVKGIIMNPDTCDLIDSFNIKLIGSGFNKNPNFRGIKIYRSIDIKRDVFEVFV